MKSRYSPVSPIQHANAASLLTMKYKAASNGAHMLKIVLARIPIINFMNRVQDRLNRYNFFHMQ